MSSNEFQTMKVWTKTHRLLRKVAAEADESIVELLHRLVREEAEKRGIKMIKFHVEISGLNTSINDMLSDEEWHSMRPDDFGTNEHWSAVTVANEQDKSSWIAAQNEWLCAAWTPNQDSGEREYNARIMSKAEATMKLLEL